MFEYDETAPIQIEPMEVIDCPSCHRRIMMGNKNCHVLSWEIIPQTGNMYVPYSVAQKVFEAQRKAEKQAKEMSDELKIVKKELRDAEIEVKRLHAIFKSIGQM